MNRRTPRCGLATLVCVLLLSGCGANMEVARIFQQAQETFDRARSPQEYLQAAGLYQQILDRGVLSGAVLYNQGNAFMEAGQRGRAIAAYRQAQRYRPRDPYLEANLRFALGAEPATSPRRPLVEYVLFWQDWLSYPEKYYLAGGVSMLAAVLGLVAVWKRRGRWPYFAAAALAVAVLAALSAGYDTWRFEAVEHGVVVEAKTVARKGNADSYQAAFNTPLAEGTEFVVADRRGDWLLIRLPAGQEGWIPERSAAVY